MHKEEKMVRVGKQKIYDKVKAEAVFEGCKSTLKQLGFEVYKGSVPLLF
jgi:hypothetical protein